jgi:hypothetical protein
VSEWLGHPFVLLVAGGILSSVVVPALTRRWQNHQKELELKTGLVTEITDVVTGLVMAVQFAELGSTTQTQEDFDTAYRDWETKSAVIASKLRAYFPKTTLVDEWHALSRLATNFYALTGMGERKLAFLRQLLDGLSDSERAPAAEAARYAAVEEAAGVELSEYRAGWLELKAHVLGCKDAIVRRVLDSRSAF